MELIHGLVLGLLLSVTYWDGSFSVDIDESVTSTYQETTDVFDKNSLFWVEENEERSYIKYVEITPYSWQKNINTHQAAILAVFPNASITHMVVDRGNFTIIVSDQKSHTIKAVTLFGPLKSLVYWDLVEGTSNKVNGIALDPVTDILYWTDAVYDIILAVALSMPNMPEIIVDEDIDDPYGIVTYPQKGYLFWTDIDIHNPRLMRSSLGGKDVQTLIQFEKGRRAFSLYIDQGAERIYWMNEVNSHSAGVEFMQEISSCDINGGSSRSLRRQIVTQYYDIGIFEGQLFFIEGGDIHIHEMDLNRSEKSAIDGQLKTLTILSKTNEFNRSNPCAESLCPGLCTSSNTTIDCFCVSSQNGGPSWHKNYCRSKSFYGLLIPKADGIFTIKPNFMEYKTDKYPKITPTSVVDSSISIRAVATDTRGQKIFYYEYGSEFSLIKSIVTSNNSVPEVISYTVGKVGGMAVDWNTNNLYWTDIKYDHIMVAKEDGRFPIILLKQLGQPKAIAIHPFRRYLFWSELDEGRVLRSYLDGSEITQILRRPAYDTIDMTVDIEYERLYLCSRHSLHEIDFNGDGYKTHYSEPLRHKFTGLTLYHDYIILSDTHYQSSGLHVFDHSRQVRGVFPYYGSLTYDSFHYGNWYGVRFHHKSLKSNYEKEQDTCDQVTLMTKDSITCICTLGYTTNNTSCEIEKSHSLVTKIFLLVADQQYNKLLQIKQTVLWEMWHLRAVPVQAIRQPYAIAYDPVDKKVYWTELESRTLSRSDIDGSNQEIIFYEPHAYFTHLEIDPGSRLVFYMTRHELMYDYGYVGPVGSIFAYNIETRMVTAIIKKGLQNPHSLAVNVEHGYIFFTDNLEVWRVDINGSGVDPIIKTVKCNVVTTFGSYLYFTHELNGFKTMIFRTDLSGQNVTEVFEFEHGHVFDMKVVDDSFIYWINGSTKSVQRMRLKNPKEITDITPYDILFQPTSLSVIMLGNYYGSSCSNMDCDDMCLPTQPDGTCTEANHTEYVADHWSGHCRIPSIENGYISNNEVGKTVPNGYMTRVTCYQAHRRSHDGWIKCKHGMWTDIPTCNLEYTICGTKKRGYKLYTTSGYYFAYPEATDVYVIGIGGGGGGYDDMNKQIKDRGKAGDGGDSKFGDSFISYGGKGGSVKAGGKGGKGFQTGGDGSIGSNCTRGGSACTSSEGVMTYNEAFCGTGGYSSECIDNLAGYVDSQLAGPGGTNGNLSTAGFFGGGAGARGGGTGGGGGFRQQAIRLEERSLTKVTVGRPGQPSYGHAGPGLIVVKWGDDPMPFNIKSFDDINVKCAQDHN
ncbi:hypothetical protein ACF0H5_011625 [Mactra antiquata]